MRKTRAGEDRQLLPAHEGIEPVDGGDARLDELVGIVARGGIHRKPVDIAVLVGKDLRTAVDRLTHSVEDATEHIARYGKLQRMTEEADFGLGKVDARGRLKKLHHRAVTVDLKHLAAAHTAVGEADLGKLVIGDALHTVNDHQRSRYLTDRFVFTDHASFSPFSAIAPISSSISTRRLA